MKLLGNRFLVKKDKQKQTGKIILLDNEFDIHPFSGEIVLIGNQVDTDEYNIGDKIIFTDMGYTVTDMMKGIDDDGIYVFVKKDDICAKIK